MTTSRTSRVLAPAVATALFLAVAGCGTEQADGTRTSAVVASSGPSGHPFAGDDSWIAYQTDRSGDEGVWLVHPDGTEDHQVLANLPNAQLPDWSPDGARLAVSTRGGKTEPLYEHDLVAGTSRQLFDCTAPCLGDDEPVYSPDGSTIAFIRYLAPFRNGMPTDCSLWVGDRASGDVRKLTSNSEPQCDREYNPRWSPDGAWLTYWRQPSADGASSTTAVFVIDADGTWERRLTDPALAAGESAWSPDGEWIVFATHPLAQYDEGESHLFRIHPDGTGLEQLTHFASAELRATQPQYSPDGRWIVFTAVTATSRSLWAISASGGDPVEMTTGGIYTHGTWQPQS